MLSGGALRIVLAPYSGPEPSERNPRALGFAGEYVLSGGALLIDMASYIGPYPLERNSLVPPPRHPFRPFRPTAPKLSLVMTLNVSGSKRAGSVLSETDGSVH